MTDEILSREQVAKLLCCEPITVDRLREAGKIHGTRYGRSYVYSKSLIAAAVRRRILEEHPELAESPEEEVAEEAPETTQASPWPLRKQSTGRVNPKISELPAIPGQH